MGKPHLRPLILLAVSCLCLAWISGVVASVPSKYSLGIDPKDASYYQSNVIKCKDGSKKFTKEQLNDEFCDCPDGTDEPGTSACPEGKFYCPNAGHIPLSIFSSRVNDGLCDCCDGSDEYDGTVSCPNTCWEAGKVAREKLTKKIKTYQEGVILRKHEVEKAKRAFAKDEEDLSKLKVEEKILKGLVDKLKENKERIEKAEEEERLRKEKEEKRLREAERQAKEKEQPSDVVHHDTTEESEQDGPKEGHNSAGEVSKDYILETEQSATYAGEQHVAEDHGNSYNSETADPSKSNEGSPSNLPHQMNVEASKRDTLPESGNDDNTRNEEAGSSHVSGQEPGNSPDTSDLSKEELGRLVASRWTGKNADTTDESADTMGDGVQEDSSKVPAEEGEDNDNDYTSETDDDRHKYDDEDFEDDADDEYVDDQAESDGSYNSEDVDKHDSYDSTDSSSSSWLDKIKQTVQNVLSSFNFFKTPVDLSEADRVRKEYDDNKSKLSKIQSRISSLTEKLKHDFGKEKEFYSFHDRCFENNQNKYVYKVCPFKQASQVEGHSTTRLGSWDKFDESYRVMQFSNGDRCWNGPDRSIMVRLRCGLTNELADVDEPSRCEYVALLSTPTVCSEDKLKELQQKLQQMNNGQLQNHDEL